MHDLIETLILPSDKRVALLVIDGLGGLPRDPGGPTELEAAATPTLDRLAREGSLGLIQPLGPGISVGSAPGHLALFGYDPVRQRIGRGLLAALGSDFPLQDADVCARGNFCTLDERGNVTDRRAGGMSRDDAASLCDLLERNLDLGDTRVFVRPVAEHRFLLVLRGERLSDQVTDTDGRLVHEPPRTCRPLREAAARTARLVDEVTHQAREILADATAADGILLRGFQKKLALPTLAERFGLHGCAAADYPMYRGLARLAGLDVISESPDRAGRFAAPPARRDEFDFFYLHDKQADAHGEDGDFDGKIAALEAIDAALPALLELQPDVLAITGDHSTPAVLGAHSWHPVPLLLWGEGVLPDLTDSFGERAALAGGLGRMEARDLMPLLLAHSGRLSRFGP